MDPPHPPKNSGRSRSSRLSSARTSRKRRHHRDSIANATSRCHQHPGTHRQLSTTDALTYLEDVRQHLKNDSQAFRTFLDVLESFENGQMDIPDVTLHLSKIFPNNSSLLSGFRIFFPEGSHTSMGPPTQPHSEKIDVVLNDLILLEDMTDVRNSTRFSSSNPVKVETNDELWGTDVGLDPFRRSASVKTEQSCSSYSYDRDEYFRASRSVSTDYGYYYVRRAFSMEHEEDSRGWGPMSRSEVAAFVQ